MQPVRNANGRFAKQVALYDVTVWGMDGDIIKFVREATPEEVDEIEEAYGDGPYSVQVEFVREEIA